MAADQSHAKGTEHKIMSRPRRALIVLGTRPEAIKLAPIILQLQQASDFEVQLCITGQHRQMLDQALRVFGLTPDYDLNVMTANQDLAQLTAKILVHFSQLLQTESPDLILVQGDTTTCLAAALGAFLARVPVAHVEAGLRTGDLASPFPEEANRTLVSRLATWHFAPTERAKENLVRENVPADQVWVTGNTVVDALLWMRTRVQMYSAAHWQSTLGPVWNVLADSRPYVLITGHRRESFGQGFQNICQAIRQLAIELPEWTFIYPVHLNPNVRVPVFEQLQGVPNVYLLEPLGYEEFIHLMDRSQLILTDSGGIQEEAPTLGKPVLVMRDVTERSEGIEAGCVRLVGTTSESIVVEAKRIMTDPEIYRDMSTCSNPFGDGQAAKRIVDILRQTVQL